MKDKFLSKAVPRGTRTIWRYLSALFILFTFAGNVWAELTAHTPGVYEKTTGEGGYGLTMVSYDPDGAGDSPAKNYEVYYFSWKSSKLYLAAGKSYVTDNTAYCLISNSGTNTTDGIDFGWGNVKCESLSGSNTSPAAEWAVPASNSSTHYMSLTNSTSLTLKVSGYDQFSFAGRDNHASTAGKQFVVTIDGEAQTFSHSATDQTVYRFDLTTGEHTIVVTGNGTDANRLRCFSLRVPSCDEANASIIANTSVYVNDELDLEFSSENTNSVAYDIKKGGSATTDASVTAAGVFQATVAGTYVVTATQAIDASGHCAVEESVTITVNPKTQVESVSVAGAAAGYKGTELTFTATAQYATAYEWYVDEVKQGSDSAKLLFTPSEAKTYSIVCKAKNAFNSDWVASTAHTYTANKLCGELVKIVLTSNTNGTVSGILTGTKDVSTQNSTSSYEDHTGYKLGGNGQYVGITELSQPLRAADVVTVYVTSVSANLILYSDKGSTKIGEKIGGVTQGANDIVLTSAATGKTAIYLYRVSADVDEKAGSNMNPFVYSLSVNRSCEESDDCSIADVTINGESVTPAGKVYSYEVAAASALTEVAVTYSTHPLATASPASGFKVAVPSAGDPANTQTITVTAEDGTHSDTYTVSVTKAATASDVVTLDALAVTGYTLDPTFDAATLAYNITKAYGAEDPTSDKVTYTKSEEAQSVDVVYDGTNHKFVVTVTAEDNTTTQDYEITINEAEAPKSLSRVLFSNGFDAFIDNTNHTVKAYYLAGTSAPTATTITAGAGTAGELSEGKIRVTGADDSYVDYIVTLAEVTPNTTTVAEEAAAGEFAGDEAWVKNGLLVYGNAAGYSAGDKWYVNRRLTKGTDPEDDQRVIAGWVRSYFFVGNASKFIMTVGGNNALKYAIDGGEQVANTSGTLEISLTKGNHMIEIVSNQSSGDCRLSAPKLVELPPTFTVNYYPNGGSGAEVIVVDDATEVAAGSIFTAPASSIFAGWNTQADGNGVAYAAGDAVTENLTLHAQWRSYFTITYMDGETELDTEDVLDGEAPVGIADPAKIGYDFAGWTLSGSDEVIDITELSASTTVYAKWTAFDGCTLWYPAASGDALNLGDNVNSLTGSFGANVAVVGMKTAESSIAYNENGLFLSGGGADVISVTLNNDMTVGTKISVTLMAANTGSRGLNLLNATGGKVKGGTKLGWDDATLGEVGTFSYTVEASDGLEGTNIFRLQRNNSVYLQCVKVESCGAAITYHNLTSEVNIAGKGTVTLGASSVREGYTTTATYSEIDPLYEFVNWTVSGAGASIADASANPATITMGTEDAVVTLNLQLIPVKFTVNYYDGETPMGTEEVAVNENPTASEIDTDKRHYTFQGWAETDGGSVVALNTITSDVAATISLYAVYAPVACPTEGTVFSMEFDPEKAPESTVKALRNGGVVELSEYATISGGDARIINNETGSDKDAITTSGQFKLTANGEVMKIELDCAIATGDVIRIPDNNQKYILSTKADKTGTYQSQTSSQHEFEATAAWNGVDDLYILYDGSSLSFTQVYVLRPYTVSFDLQGHGDAIDDQKLVAGKKVVAPTAPTADGWDFAGWYKEAACMNAWDFDNDVVEGNMSLFAKWTEHVTNDATLKSLKYGNTAIELEEGVYTYAVELAAAVAAVPALSAETNAALATKVITNAEAFEAGQATSTVLVTAEDGETQLLYTVNFTKEAAIALQDVTGNMTWDFSKANDGTAATSGLCNEAVLVNVPGIVNNSEFESDNIMATANKFTSNTNGKLQASMIKFHTTVSGSVIVKFANTGSKTEYRYLVVNGVQTEAKSKDATTVTYAEYVPAGDVVLTVTTGNGGNMFNFTSVEFKLDNDLEPARTDEWLAPGEMGTICIPQGAVAVGADIYDLVGKEPQYGKVVFETVKHMKPGKPYMFIAKGTRIDLILTDETPATEPDNSGAMKGTFEQTYLTELENVYYFAGNALWGCADLVQLDVPANRAYVKLDEVEYIQSPEPAPGRRRVSLGVNGKGTATGIDAINASEKPMKLMIDGQIYILRGEKVFDATGRLVK